MMLTMSTSATRMHCDGHAIQCGCTTMRTMGSTAMETIDNAPLGMVRL